MEERGYHALRVEEVAGGVMGIITEKRELHMKQLAPAVVLILLLASFGIVYSPCKLSESVSGNEFPGQKVVSGSQEDMSRNDDRNQQDNHIEQDEFGGSWFDDFEDDSGILIKDNVSLNKGKVGIDCWKYKCPITILNNGGTILNYSVLITLNNFNFNYSKADEKGNDIRFKDENGNDLNYWIENWNLTGGSNIWVKLGNIPNGESTIYLYYGNPNAEKQSNGEVVFDFFDDFNDNIIDVEKWTSRTFNGGIIEEKNGEMMQSGDDDWHGAGAQTKKSYRVLQEPK